MTLKRKYLNEPDKSDQLKAFNFNLARRVHFGSKVQLVAHCLAQKTLKNDCNFARCALNAFPGLGTTLRNARTDLYRYRSKKPLFQKKNFFWGGVNWQIWTFFEKNMLDDPKYDPYQVKLH